MSDKNMKLMLSLSAKDEGATSSLKKMEDNIKRTATSAVRESEKAGKTQENIIRKIEREHQRAAAARSRLGIRSEQEIQREIIRTQRAFESLARSGKASQNDLQRAAKATRQRISELNQELGKSSNLQNGLKVAGSLVAAGRGAMQILTPAMNDKKLLNSNINYVAKQGFIESEKNPEWTGKEGANEIKNLVEHLLTKFKLGNADSALELISGMMASGMSLEQVKQNAEDSYGAMLAASEKPGEFNPGDTAKLMKVFTDYIGDRKDITIGQMFDRAVQSGLDGKFEIPDMVRELPSILAASKKAGFNNLTDYDQILSGLQSAANKNGSNAEAATEINNMLDKLVSHSTITRASKMENPDRPGTYLDWENMILEGKKKGMNAVDVAVLTINKILAKDKDYQALKAKAENGDENAKSSMVTKQGLVIDDLIPEVRAKRGLQALLDKQQIDGYMQSLGNLDPNHPKLVDRSIAIMQQDAGNTQSANESLKLLRQDSLNPLIDAEKKLSELTAEYPNATLALQTLTAASYKLVEAFVILTALGVGKNGAGLLGKGVAAAGGAAKGAGKILGKAGPAVVAGLGAYTAYEIEQNNQLNRDQKNDEQIKNAAETGGTLVGMSAGAYAGAAIGSIVPGIGTAIGGLIGGIIGGVAGSYGGEALADNANKSRELYKNTIPVDFYLDIQKRMPEMIPSLEATDPTIVQRVAEFQDAINNNTNTIGAQLDTINNTLEGQQQVIQNNISLNIDGRVVAEQVSQYQLNTYNRGGSQ